jgi:hypothetical protein
MTRRLSKPVGFLLRLSSVGLWRLQLCEGLWYSGGIVHSVWYAMVEALEYFIG